MRQGDTVRRSVIRYIRSEIHNQEIASQTELDDEGIIGVLIRQVQQRRESIEAFAKGNRQDLVEKEKAELAVVLEYLPEQMSRQEIEKVVREAIEQVGALGLKDMGKVMGFVMPKVRGRAEGRAVSTLASELLRALDG